MVMTDIETLSTAPNAVIVTIASVKFSLTSDKVETFSINVNPRSSKELGLHIDIDTLNWWKKQKPEVMQAWMHSQVDLPSALDQFTEFCGNDKNTLHWCNGENFDFPILESSYRATGRSVPWKHWNLRDARTMYWAGGLDTFNEPRVGLYHDALSDCHTQVAWLKKAMGVPSV